MGCQVWETLGQWLSPGSGMCAIEGAHDLIIAQVRVNLRRRDSSMAKELLHVA